MVFQWSGFGENQFHREIKEGKEAPPAPAAAPAAFHRRRRRWLHRRP